MGVGVGILVGAGGSAGAGGIGYMHTCENSLVNAKAGGHNVRVAVGW